MNKLYLILLTLVTLSSCKDKDAINEQWVDLRGIAGTWEFNGDRDFTVEFIPDYGKDLKRGKLITREKEEYQNIFIYSIH